MLRLFYLLPFFLGTLALPLQAQTVSGTLTDSSLPLDTIGIHQQRTLFASTHTYSYHAATQLSGLQLMPLLRQSTDSITSRLVSRAHRRYLMPVPLLVGSYGLILGSVRADPVKNPELAGTLVIGSLATLVTAYVAGLSAPVTMRRAVQRYNLLATTTEAAYVKPLPLTGQLRLTLTDTVGIKRGILASRYTYRGIQLAPELQLQTAMKSFNDPFITEGLRQNRVVRGLAGVIGTVSASFLTTYYMTQFLVKATGRRIGPTNSLVYYALTGVAVSFTLGRVADKTTRQIVNRYNEQVAVNRYQ